VGELPLSILAAASLITLFAGFVKGAVGFAMPMIMISGLASLLSPPEALAALILPTLASNLMQAFGDGTRQMRATVAEWWRLILVTCVCVAVSAQFMTAIPDAPLLLALGLPVTLFAVLQLLGRPIRYGVANRGRAEVLTGIVGGLYGGVSGIWGPPLVALLLSLDVDRRESIRVQGTIYLIGAAVLLVAHLGSGVLNDRTLPLSAWLVIPALLGVVIGQKVQMRLNHERFRRWTLVVLLLTGLNLVRRALA
jgi:hypothetical protein